MANYKSFEEMDVWQMAFGISKKIYKITNENDKLRKDYGLRDQVRRSSVSVFSNIAEGFERDNNNEFVRFLLIAKGSAGELRGQLLLIKELELADQEQIMGLINEVTSVSKQLSKFIKYLKKFKEENLKS